MDSMIVGIEFGIWRDCVNFGGMCEFWTGCEFYIGKIMEPRIKSELSPRSGGVRR